MVCVSLSFVVVYILTQKLIDQSNTHESLLLSSVVRINIINIQHLLCNNYQTLNGDIMHLNIGSELNFHPEKGLPQIKPPTCRSLDILLKSAGVVADETTRGC